MAEVRLVDVCQVLEDALTIAKSLHVLKPIVASCNTVEQQVKIVSDGNRGSFDSVHARSGPLVQRISLGSKRLIWPKPTRIG